LRELSVVQLTPKEQALVDRVIQKIQEFDPQAIVKIADDTIEHEDVLLLGYTDKPSLETIQHIVPYTGDILVNEDWTSSLCQRIEAEFRTGWSNRGTFYGQLEKANRFVTRIEGVISRPGTTAGTDDPNTSVRFQGSEHRKMARG
jgi:hypothetical protein